jgi:hypothetical protein
MYSANLKTRAGNDKNFPVKNSKTNIEKKLLMSPVGTVKIGTFAEKEICHRFYGYCWVRFSMKNTLRTANTDLGVDIYSMWENTPSG